MPFILLFLFYTIYGVKCYSNIFLTNDYKPFCIHLYISAIIIFVGLICIKIAVEYHILKYISKILKQT